MLDLVHRLEHHTKIRIAGTINIIALQNGGYC